MPKPKLTPAEEYRVPLNMPDAAPVTDRMERPHVDDDPDREDDTALPQGVQYTDTDDDLESGAELMRRARRGDLAHVDPPAVSELPRISVIRLPRREPDRELETMRAAEIGTAVAAALHAENAELRDELRALRRTMTSGLPTTFESSPVPRADPLPRRRPLTPLDPYVLHAAPPWALEAYERALARVLALGIRMPRFTVEWASGPPTRCLGHCQAFGGAVRIILNVQSPDLEAVSLHEFAHVLDLYRFGDQLSDETMEARARKFVQWVRTTPPPEAPSPHPGQGRRWS